MARDVLLQLQIGDVVASRVKVVRERHQLGVPSEVEVDFELAEYADLDDLLGQTALLAIEHQGADPHLFGGVVETATVRGSAMTIALVRAYRYRVRIVSRMALLAGDFSSTIYQQLDVKEVVAKVLEVHGIEAGATEWRLRGTYPKRELCVQYQETALAFVSRLLEEEGIYWFSEYPEGKEKIVFADDSTGAEPVEGERAFPYRGRSGMVDGTDAVIHLSERRRVVSGKFVLRDFDHGRPALDLTGEAVADVDTDLEVYDYPGRYLEPADGKRRAQVELEAEQALRHTVHGDFVSTRVRAGRKLELTDAHEADGEYVVTAASIDFEVGERSTSIVTRAELLPLAVKYRSPRRTPLPIIEGPQTAVIAAPDSAQPEEIHTDERGCCKVRFHWDTAGITDDKASCWIRVEQQQTSGSMVLPRVDWEFVVEFLEGNPDRPLVAGRLYNGVYMPPYALPEGKTRTAIGTATSPGGGGKNEIRFEDKSGSEEVAITSQYDTNIAVANNKTKNVGNNETQSVGVNNSVKVGADQSIKVTKGAQNTIGGSQTVTVGGNRNLEANAVIGLTVKGASTTSIGGNQTEMIGNALEAALALAAEKAAEIAAAKAGEALAKVEGAVQGAVDQALGPVNALTNKAEAIGGAMNALKGGDMAAMGGLLGAAGGLPSAGAMGAAMGGGPSGGLAATTRPGGQGASAAGVSGGNLASSMAQSAIQKGMGKAKKALGLGGGGGGGGEGGGGSSGANQAGPAGGVAAVAETDREKGPGHGISKVTGTHSEKVAALKVTAAASGIMNNVAASMTRKVGAAHVEIVAGNRAESVEAAKNETALGLVVLSKADETVTVKGPHQTMVGGAIIDLVTGNRSVTASAPGTFIGAFHKVEASGKITFKCGGSEVIIDGSGVTLKSTMIAITASKIQLPKAVGEVV